MNIYTFWRTPVLSVLHLLRGVLLISLLSVHLAILLLQFYHIRGVTCSQHGLGEDEGVLGLHNSQGEEEQGQLAELLGLRVPQQEREFLRG